MVAEVIINTIAKELNRTYDYIIPDSILNELKIGSRVFVPFGRSKQKEGFVIGIKKDSEFANKEIIKVEDNILTKDNVELAKLMSRRYFCNISDCIKLMLPPGATSTNIQNRVKDKTESFVYLKKDKEQIEFDIESKEIKSQKQIKLLRFLFENEGIHVLDLQYLTEVSRNIINTLIKNDYIEIVQERVERNPFIHKNIKKDRALQLTKEQQIAYNKIVASEFKEFLIYGVTGSRKNRNIHANNRKHIKKQQNSNCISTRNITYTTNGR